MPTIGASGAISGVLGAYFILYPRARVITLVPIFILPWIVEIPTLVYLGFWFLSQLFNGVLAIAVGSQSFGGIAWWAHAGGFLAGTILILHTPGGRVLAAEQIAHAIRKHPAKVTVFVPHYAMSGGRLISLAADEIVMDDNAVLGSVDPQLG